MDVRCVDTIFDFLFSRRVLEPRFPIRQVIAEL
jgi:hypothetical protein